MLHGRVADHDVDRLGPAEQADDLGIHPRDGPELAGPILAVVRPGDPGRRVRLPFRGHPKTKLGGGFHEFCLECNATRRKSPGRAESDWMNGGGGGRLFRCAEGQAVYISFEGGHFPFEGGHLLGLAPFERKVAPFERGMIPFVGAHPSGSPREADSGCRLGRGLVLPNSVAGFRGRHSERRPRRPFRRETQSTGGKGR